MSVTRDDLYASPDHYLHSLDGDTAVFVPMDRAAYHRSIFLDARIEPAGQGAMRIPVAALTGAAPPPQPTGWIFHVAHCGSTLLARALDNPAANLVLREPLALRQCAFLPAGQRLAMVTAMVSKRYAKDLPTIVKANVPVNFLLPRLAALDGGTRAIFLYLPLSDYLLAILRSDNHRDWLRRVTTQLAPHLGDPTGQSDAQRAAALWLAQVRAFAAAGGDWPNARSLDAERFFADPAPVLAAVAGHLNVQLTPVAIQRTVAGPLFRTYSKNPEVAFDSQARLDRRRALERELADELAAAERWVDGRGAEPMRALAAISLAA